MKATITHPVTGNKVVSTSQRRYVVVADYGSKAFVAKRSDNLWSVKNFARRRGSAMLVIYDTLDGKFV